MSLHTLTSEKAIFEELKHLEKHYISLEKLPLFKSIKKLTLDENEKIKLNDLLVMSPSELLKSLFLYLKEITNSSHLSSIASDLMSRIAGEQPSFQTHITPEIREGIQWCAEQTNRELDNTLYKQSKKSDNLFTKIDTLLTFIFFIKKNNNHYPVFENLKEKLEILKEKLYRLDKKRKLVESSSPDDIDVELDELNDELDELNTELDEIETLLLDAFKSEFIDHFKNLCASIYNKTISSPNSAKVSIQSFQQQKEELRKRIHLVARLSLSLHEKPHQTEKQENPAHQWIKEAALHHYAARVLFKDEKQKKIKSFIINLINQLLPGLTLEIRSAIMKDTFILTKNNVFQLAKQPSQKQTKQPSQKQISASAPPPLRLQ